MDIDSNKGHYTAPSLVIYSKTASYIIPKFATISTKSIITNLRMSSINPSGDKMNPFANLASTLEDLEIGGTSAEEGDSSASQTPPSNDGDEQSESEDDPERPENMLFEHPVDLVTYEEQKGSTPIFSRALLEQIWQDRKTIEERKGQTTYTGTDGTVFKTWEAIMPDILQANYRQVHYLPRVVLHPDFQKTYGQFRLSLQLLRRYNGVGAETHITAPYTVETYRRIYENEHKSIDTMDAYRNAIKKTSNLWNKSSARNLLRQNIIDASTRSAPIKKIICFGLGCLSLDPRWYTSALQHIAVFDIAQTLHEEYERAGRGDVMKPIEIILQDPMYEEKDRQTLHRLHKYRLGAEKMSSTLRFVSDPEGLLAIDEHTLIVTAFLPVEVPLMQILADLFAAGGGPAMMICDRMKPDTEKTEYTLRDRDAPHVARWLSEQYSKLEGGFEEHHLEPELRRDVYEESAREDRYWLKKMDLWVRKI
ncbi:hypothetical protein N0V83_008107 [Neocucurbitaria cava]|uniref:SRR1-like domain-containing protein n=1 Tax=Neocucurbitaria cava TaxID=798079 RepID=A0A9W8Y4V3_9PLEO|nr:hypothetical protein N0V83_008107 [Neocucurbitaria cava]